MQKTILKGACPLKDSTNEYKYLGFIFSNSRSTEKGTSSLINQAQKAWFSIKYYLSFSNQKNINTYYPFDTQIKSILLYTCEAWSETIKGNIDDTTLLTKNKTRVSRSLKILSKISILLELGRYQITSYTQNTLYKYTK